MHRGISRSSNGELLAGLTGLSDLLDEDGDLLSASPSGSAEPVDLEQLTVDSECAGLWLGSLPPELILEISFFLPYNALLPFALLCSYCWDSTISKHGPHLYGPIHFPVFWEKTKTIVVRQGGPVAADATTISECMSYNLLSKFESATTFLAFNISETNRKFREEFAAVELLHSEIAELDNLATRGVYLISQSPSPMSREDLLSMGLVKTKSAGEVMLDVFSIRAPKPTTIRIFKNPYNAFTAVRKSRKPLVRQKHCVFVLALGGGNFQEWRELLSSGPCDMNRIRESTVGFFVPTEEITLSSEELPFPVRSYMFSSVHTLPVFREQGPLIQDGSIADRGTFDLST